MNWFNRIFNYALSTEIVFGFKAIQELPRRVEQLQGSKVFVVSDPGVEQVGILKKVTKLLQEAQIPFQSFTEVEREPHVTTINQATNKAKSFGADLVIGIGGGSALDAAKAVAVMMKNKGEITQYAGLDNIPNPGIPVICIPTTAGTGSEVTIWTVISEGEHQRKKVGIGGKYVAPTMAICDPELTVSLPPDVTAATGMDALTHALESFVNKATQPISRALSRESMRLIAKSLRVAVSQGDNLEARYDMLLASTIAGMAFNPTRLGLSHALCMPLGEYKVPHGIANAILLPRVMEFNYVGNLESFAEITQIFGKETDGMSIREAAKLSAEVIYELSKDIGIPPSLKAFGVTEDDLDYIAKAGMESGNVLVNPRKPTLEDLKEIVRKCL